MRITFMQFDNKGQRVLTPDNNAVFESYLEAVLNARPELRTDLRQRGFALASVSSAVPDGVSDAAAIAELDAWANRCGASIAFRRVTTHTRGLTGEQFRVVRGTFTAKAGQTATSLAEF
jgi:hypothetical protein